MSYYDYYDDYSELFPTSCPYEDAEGYVLDSAGWSDWESSVWVEVWSAKCTDCGMAWEDRDEEIRIEVTALEEMLMESAA